MPMASIEAAALERSSSSDLMVLGAGGLKSAGEGTETGLGGGGDERSVSGVEIAGCDRVAAVERNEARQLLVRLALRFVFERDDAAQIGRDLAHQRGRVARNLRPDLLQ